MPDTEFLPSRTVLDAFEDAFLLLDSSGRPLYANQAAEKLFDLAKGRRKSALRQLIKELEPASIFQIRDSAAVQQRKIVLGERIFLVRAQLGVQLGTRFEIETGAHCGQTRLAVILRDITDLRQLAADYSASATQLARMTAALRQMDSGLLVTDAWGRIVFFNPALEALLPPAALVRAQGARAADIFAFMDDFSQGTAQEKLRSLQPLLPPPGQAPTDGTTPLTVTRRPLMYCDGCHDALYIFEAAPSDEDASGVIPAPSAAPGTIAPSPPTAARAKAEEERNTGGAQYALSDFVGQSREILRLKEMIRKVARTSSTVLIQSESGTGKELLAHSLHALSKRSHAPFIKLNCASLPESLLESEIFGYEAGAFTGAKKGGHAGRFEQAHGGTIFLDEIGEMSLSLQAKLLRIIQEREVQRLGGQSTRRVDVRIICATNCDLSAQMRLQLFRSDLYYRLSVVSISIPPLREHKEDIKSLVIHFLRHYSRLFQKRVKGVSKDVYNAFMLYDWPGNVREFANVIEYAFNILEGDLIEMEHLPSQLLHQADAELKSSGNMDALLRAYSVRLVEHALERCKGHKSAAAKALGISRATLYRLLAQDRP